MKHALKLMLIILVTVAIGFCLSACDEEHVHSAVKVEGIAANCLTEGRLEHWSCSGCSELFSDEACTKKTTEDALKISAKGHSPKADDGDCTTAIKCANCDEITTEAKAAHAPEADDGNCTTSVKCTNCNVITTEAKAAHAPEADDGDCTTSVKCANCDVITTEAKTAHIPKADDGDCTTAVKCENCDVITTEAKAAHIPEADDGYCTTAIKCENCDVITTEAMADHTPEADDGDCTTAVKCANCDVMIIVAMAAHTPEADDGDCTTAVKCANCNVITTEAKADHTPEADDGDCTTAIKCANCDEITTEAKEAHVDEALNGVCDVCSKQLDYVTVEETSTIYVFTAQGLYHYAEEGWGYNGVLMRDIVLPAEPIFDLNEDGVNESNWEPFPLYNATFDGGGHSITGVTVIHSETSNPVGFVFTTNESAIIKDLHLVDVAISGGLRIGGIAGEIDGLIIGCSVSGSVRAHINDAGGIAGYCGGNGSIIGCYNDATISANGGNAAGICGQLYSNQGIIACYNTGEVISNDSDSSGISGTTYKGALVGCYSVGEIKGLEPFGITSYVDADDGKIIGCYFAIGEGRDWSEYGDLAEYGGAIKAVDAETLSWSDVLTEINTVLDEANATFRYELNEGDGAATRPLVLVPIE